MCKSVGLYLLLKLTFVKFGEGLLTFAKLDEGCQLALKVAKDLSRTYNRISLVKKKPIYIQQSNAYTLLPDFAADPANLPAEPPAASPRLDLAPKTSRFKQKAQARFLKCQLKRDNDSREAALLDEYIEWAEDKKPLWQNGTLKTQNLRQ